MTKPAVGIDFGTSTSEAAVYRRGQPSMVPDPATKVPIVPSLVAVDAQGNLLVGEEAASWVDKPGHGVREVKRMLGTSKTVKLGGKDYRPEEIAAQVLNKMRRNLEEALATTVDEIVLTVPANFPDAARNATLTAAELTGLKVLRLINEPTAAAMAYGIRNLDKEEQLLVFDFGGGTLDVTILEMVEGVMDVIASFGDPQLGGKDIDQAIQNRFLKQFKAKHPGAEVSNHAVMSLKAFAEQAKKTLTHQASFSGVLSNFGVEHGKPVDFEAVLTREEFEAVIDPILKRAGKVLHKAMKAKNVRPSAIDKVLLVGGTTYIPAVRNMIRQDLGKEPVTDVEPDLAVSQGACIQAALITDQISMEDGLILTDVSPFGLGIDVVSPVGQQLMLVYEALMPPNTKIPYSVKRSYSLLHTDQKEVVVHLYQDHTGKAQLPAQAIDTGLNGKITDIPPALLGTPHAIEIDFTYDLNGCAVVTATVPGVGKSVRIEYAPASNRMSDEEKAEAAERFKALSKNEPVRKVSFAAHKQNNFKRYQPIIKKAEGLIADAEGGAAYSVQAALDELLTTLNGEDDARIQQAADKLVDTMFDLENEF